MSVDIGRLKFLSLRRIQPKNEIAEYDRDYARRSKKLKMLFAAPASSLRKWVDGGVCKFAWESCARLASSFAASTSSPAGINMFVYGT
jgi:hypothetical protein